MVAQTEKNLARLKNSPIKFSKTDILDNLNKTVYNRTIQQTPQQPKINLSNFKRQEDEIDRLLQEKKQQKQKLLEDLQRKKELIKQKKIEKEKEIQQKKHKQQDIEDIPQNNYMPQKPAQNELPMILNYDPKIGNTFHFDDFIQTNVLMNRGRNPDLNHYERAILFAQAREVDTLRMLTRLNPQSELYRFKLEQYKDTSTSISEMQKVLQNYIVKNMAFQYEQEVDDITKFKEQKYWVDEQRRKMVAVDAREALGPDPVLMTQKPAQDNNNKGNGAGQNFHTQLNQDLHNQGQGYDPSAGFIVYWDYLIGIINDQNQIDIIQPKGLTLVCTIVCEGEKLIEEFNLDIKPVQNQSGQKLMALFMDQSHIQNILINPETLMIWEVLVCDQHNPDEGEVESLGWTQIDLFEVSGDLKRGYWKCPFYKTPVNYSITKQGIQDLEVFYGPWIYLRIAFPWKDQYTTVDSFDHQLTAGKYFIPEIHLRAAYYKPPIEIDYQQTVKYIEKPQNPKFEPLHKKRSFNIEQMPEPDQIPENILPKSGNFSNKKRGIKITLHAIRKHIAASHNKIAITLLEAKNHIYDDNGKDCLRNTTIHNPFMPTEENPQYKKISNKAKNSDIVFNEEFIFLRNFPILFRRNQNEIYIVFQVIEKPEPKEILTKDKVAYQQNRDDNFGGMEYRLIAWACFNVMNQDGQIKNGKFTIKTFKPPYRLPPVDPEKVIVGNEQIEFSLIEYEYDKEDLIKQKQNLLERSQEKSKKGKRELQRGDFDVKIDNRPFIPNTKPQYKDKTFIKGSGIDFYIDCARYLPDNVTVAKIQLQFINKQLEDQFQEQHLLPKFDSPTYNPIFDSRHELRSDDIDSTLMALITLITKDKSCNENRTIGYAVINLFINRYNKVQPDQQNDPDKVLYDGCYEIPIISEEFLRSRPFTVEKLLRYNKIPAASLLVRIRMAEKTDDGKRVLSSEDYPQSEWVARKIWIPRPLYSSSVYNNSMKPLQQNELDLYSFRQSRPDITVEESAKLLIHSQNINKDMSKLELFKWCDQNITKDQTTKFIDQMFFAKFQPQCGFKFILDGVNNIKSEKVVVGFYSLNPPGKYYQEKQETSELIFNGLINWDSPLGQTIFFDKWYYFRDIEFNSRIHIVVELFLVSIKSGAVNLKKFAWTLIPIFHAKGYTKSGNFQIPLFQYPINTELLNDIVNTQEDIWDQVKMYLKDAKIQYKNLSSIFCRILDCQRDGQLEEKIDIDTLDYCYLSKNKKELKSFAFNQQVKDLNQKKQKLHTLIPENIHRLDFNKKIIDKALMKFNIQNFDFDFNQQINLKTSLIIQ